VRPLDDLLVALGQALLDGAGASQAGLAVTAVDVTVPIEARVDRDGQLRASLPRGVMATGFQLPHARLHARFVSTPAEGA
jgi:hypothetical protein